MNKNFDQTFILLEIIILLGIRKLIEEYEFIWSLLDMY